MLMKTETKDLTELVLEEERDVDDEMDEGDEDGDGGGNRYGDDDFYDGRKIRHPGVFLNANFADSEDMDDEMDGEEEEEEDEDCNSSNDGSKSSSGASSNCKYSCSVCGETAFISKKSLRQHVRCEHLDSCYWTCQSCGGVFADAELFKVRISPNVRTVSVQSVFKCLSLFRYMLPNVRARTWYDNQIV